MYFKILFNHNLKLKERIKRSLAYVSRRRGARVGWNKLFKEIFRLHPEYRKPDDILIEKEHRLFWSYFSHRINMSTLRICKNISGLSNSKYIPEEIFFADIEPTLNQTPEAEYLAFKSIYNRWFPGNIFPRDYFHNVEGEWLDQNLNSISFSDVESMALKLLYPVVIKPNRDSYGGKGILFLQNSNDLHEYIYKNKNFLVQEKIKQHPYFTRYHENSLNSIRVYVYRSVIDNKINIINTVFRMGLGSVSVDNISAGGIFTLINKDGYLNGFAVDKHGKKYLKHPDTGIDFNDRIPDWNGLKEISVNIGHKIFYARLIGLDLCYDSESHWRVIEINIFGSSIRATQHLGVMFFGEFTDEIRNYCINNHWAVK